MFEFFTFTFFIWSLNVLTSNYPIRKPTVLHALGCQNPMIKSVGHKYILYYLSVVSLGGIINPLCNYKLSAGR